MDFFVFGPQLSKRAVSWAKKKSAFPRPFSLLLLPHAVGLTDV
jgi:hypothetical protein